MKLEYECSSILDLRWRTVGLCSKDYLHNLRHLSNSISLAAGKRLQKIKTPNFKMAIWPTALISVLFVVIHFAGVTWAANAARNREITANSTCGSPPEIFYSVVERKKSPRYRIKSYCNATDSILSHNASKMVDGKFETWWQSSASIDKVSITIDLRGEYQKVRYEFRKLIYADIDQLP